MGTPVIALCGKVWVPSRAPEKFPVCPACKEIWEQMKDGDARGLREVTGRLEPVPLSPAWPDRAAWGTATSLRAWQTAAMHDYFDRSPRDYLAVATPGRGQDHVRAVGRRRADRTPHRRPDHRRRADRAPQEPVGRGRGARGHPARPDLQRRQGQDLLRLRRRRRDVRRRRGQPARDADPHRAVQDAGHPRRGAPRGRRAVVGRGRPRGVPAGDPAAGADRHAVPLRRQPDPVRHLRSPGATASRARSPTSPTATRTRWPTTSYVRCCSWPTPATCSGAPAPATRSRPGSASPSPRT